MLKTTKNMHKKTHSYTKDYKFKEKAIAWANTTAEKRENYYN